MKIFRFLGGLIPLPIIVLAVLIAFLVFVEMWFLASKMEISLKSIDNRLAVVESIKPVVIYVATPSSATARTIKR